MNLFAASKLVGFLSRYGHIIAIAVALVAGLWWAHNAGVQKERAKWEAAQAEATEALRANLRAANEKSREAAAKVASLERERQEIVDGYEKALAQSTDLDSPVCVGPDGMRDLRDTIERLRPKRRPS